jgi:hypothetical protein
MLGNEAGLPVVFWLMALALAAILLVLPIGWRRCSARA